MLSVFVILLVTDDYEAGLRGLKCTGCLTGAHEIKRILLNKKNHLNLITCFIILCSLLGVDDIDLRLSHVIRWRFLR